ncbi:transmembrane protein 54 [Hyla sarda]|uniref:transmembrane protein 54 n=1 Tax=Hyla sarda TaxID=327740 RepID=UPI0024C299EB|nr:transmembrane protein 54 [Hyla sarda]
MNAIISAACTVGLTVSVIITVANEGRTLLSTCSSNNLQLMQISHQCPFDPTRIYSTTLCLWVISILLDAAEMVFSAQCYFTVLQLMDVHLCHKKRKKVRIQTPLEERRASVEEEMLRSYL